MSAPGIRPLLLTSPVGRRRRPSGEAPPLPRTVQRSTKVYALLTALVAVWWIALSTRPVLAFATAVDTTILRIVARFRVESVTSMMLTVQALGSHWVARAVAWPTIVVLVAFRRFQHLVAYLAVLLGVSLLVSAVLSGIGRMRPMEVDVIGRWTGYAHPSRPVTALALVLAGATFTLLPAGRWRVRAALTAGAVLALLCSAQLYLAVDHPSDVLAALVAGWALPVVILRLLVPEDAFPVTYRRGRRAHLDLGGRRRDAIIGALDHQLGLDVEVVQPFGQEASAGSTPLLLHARRPDGSPVALFGKLYARSHLRSDRWYKLARTVLYGRLEDEKPFSSVRRLVEYEDHMLRLLRDAGLPTPTPYGFVEITPEREYLIVMEFFPGADELGAAPIGDEVIAQGLEIVHRLWDAGVAHRDIKPSNVLVQEDHVLLIDVAFATVRPTPWRQAVDLANMMLTLALASTPERVYALAASRFAEEDIAEAFAACRSITVPNQLRERLRSDGRDLVGSFRTIAPERRPVRIQVWSVRRLALSVGVAAGLVLAASLVATYVRVAGLL